MHALIRSLRYVASPVDLAVSYYSRPGRELVRARFFGLLSHCRPFFHLQNGIVAIWQHLAYFSLKAVLLVYGGIRPLVDLLQRKNEALQPTAIFAKTL